jgi:opacity protein-like surface antigen
MRYITYLLLGVTTSALVMARPAAADSSAASKGTFSARLGYDRPTSGDVRDAAGSSVDLGVSYTVKPKESSSVTPRIDLDYANFSKSGTKVQPISVMVNAIKPLSKTENSGPYVGAGLGIAHVKIDAGSSGLGNLAAGDSSSGSTIAGQLLAGYNFSSRFFAEGTYRAIEHRSGVDPSSALVSVGVRF